MSSILDTLATVSEDLAVELLSNYTQDDIEELKNLLHHLSQAATVLTDNDREAPFPVKELLRNYQPSELKFQ